jgi:uncharacterized protein (TIGR02996 family)
MALDQAFLDDIIEHPDDDTPRLIYADWLEDRGDQASAARAEFIRVQCRLSACRLSANQGMQGTRALFQRQRDILAEYEQQWVNDFGVPLAEYRFERGFLSAVLVEVAVLLTHADRFFHQAPVRQLRLFWDSAPPAKRAGDLQRLCALPGMRNMLSLEMPGQHLPSAAVEVLAKCEGLTGLRVLDLSQNQIGDAGLRALADSFLLPRLFLLNLGNNDITVRGLRHLMSCVEKLEAVGITPHLRTLTLSRDPLSARGCSLIWAHSYLSRVVRLV